MKINPDKITIATTVGNWDLYQKTVKSFPERVKKYAIDGSKGFYGLRSLIYIIKKLKSEDMEWLILADEDVVFTQPDRTFSLINFMKEHDYTVCGMRDGGTLHWRNENPFSINTYFTILNLQKVYEIFDEKEIYQNQYILENEFDQDLNKVNFQNYKPFSLFEEYYCFFFWLLRNGKKFFYLNADNPSNDETTAVFDNEGEIFLYHAWYARFYNENKIHTERIEDMLKKGKYVEQTSSPIIIKDRYYHLRYFFYKIYRDILRKLR
ncbi:hypothetical protein [Gramella sp. AN32]|uniref:Nucleotide-diphospho-sugar transferase domain-containing protein n=1 Tax=Christiangramia antarctica TaxID=2058158 RepID=A0ABW5XA34_9FLAO|nr:hypothetical protein [Gramella sp. AN32]MCM4154698.1 hypothetical protein [Gramella sp. AN32]